MYMFIKLYIFLILKCALPKVAYLKDAAVKRLTRQTLARSVISMITPMGLGKPHGYNLLT
jgi:hypothetical protein